MSDCSEGRALYAFHSYEQVAQNGLTFQTVFQYHASLLLALKEDPPSSLLEERKADQLGLPQTLQQEFSLINVQIRNVNVEVSPSSESACWLLMAVCRKRDYFGWISASK